MLGRVFDLCWIGTHSNAYVLFLCWWLLSMLFQRRKPMPGPFWNCISYICPLRSRWQALLCQTTDCWIAKCNLISHVQRWSLCLYSRPLYFEYLICCKAWSRISPSRLCIKIMVPWPIPCPSLDCPWMYILESSTVMHNASTFEVTGLASLPPWRCISSLQTLIMFL